MGSTPTTVPAGRGAGPARAGGGPTLVQIAVGELSEGFASAADRVMVLAEADIFGKATRRAMSRRRTGLASLSQLGVGDYVVHVTHGVGRYIGLVQLTLRGVPGDYVQLEYAGGDKLYLPVYRLHEIERYVAAEGKPPKLDKMGGTTFLVKAGKVKQEVRQMAEELLQIYAQRESQPGVAYPAMASETQAFEDSFPFAETPDQLEAIEAVQRDLSRGAADGSPGLRGRRVRQDRGGAAGGVPRGDGGQAGGRAGADDGAGAAALPDVLASAWHAFPLEVAVHLNRFASDKAAEAGRRAAAQRGEVDVVIGTHRLLGRDVRFKDLGLLVIDEEQRFGVAQKERFKKFKAQVDVLTLSATPIPRTLHMSLLGIREIR
jgi:transcription-repair coupling factor (superfamily II helicase)